MLEQKLFERKTYTPTSTPHACGSVSLCLNSSVAVRTVMQTSKTSYNNPDEALTPKVSKLVCYAKQGGQNYSVQSEVSVIYVLNHNGSPLMPTTPRKTRVLLRKGEAYVFKRTPFVIKLNKIVGRNLQHITLGVDAGYAHVGLSAITDKKEVHAAQVGIRTDMVKLNSERRQYRRARRHRKTWHRKPRFLNRAIPKGWLAPSIQHKLDTHIKLVQRVCQTLPTPDVIIEVGSFDVQQIKNPDISSKEYQQGEQLGFYNVREYIFHRDHHTCQHCKGKNLVLIVHHIVSRQVGGDRPENLITLCKECHDKHHSGEIELKIKKSKGFRAETFMSTVRWKLVERLEELGFKVKSTYGYITKYKREELGLQKSHVNDAFVIAGGSTQKRCNQHLLKQVRKQNRKLYKGIRSHIRNTALRFIRGFQRFDKVLYEGLECFIFGRRVRGYFDIRLLNGTVVSHSVSYKKLQLLESFRTLLFEKGVCSNSSFA